MRRILSMVLSVALAVSTFVGTASPVFAAGARSGQISGIALASSGRHLVGQIARLRNVDVGHVASVTTTNASGQFVFSGVSEGVYIVELVSNGYVVGASAPVALTARDMTADGVTALAAGGAQAQTGALAGSFWVSTAGIITVAAIAGGVVTAIVVAGGDESPSR